MTNRKVIREHGDMPILTDAMYNFVPGSSFEIGVSLSILDHPGEAGLIIDNYATQLESIIHRVLTTELGNREIKLTPASTPIKLKDYFNNKILKELIPTSDQIGRCFNRSKTQEWLNGAGREWLCRELLCSSGAVDYTYKNMLTKIRSISAFGTILRELMPNCQDTAAVLLKKDESELHTRNTEINMKIRHAQFDNPTTRARTEKIPLVGGKALTTYPEVSASLTEAAPKGLGFGKVWHDEEMKSQNASGQKIIEEYRELEKTYGRQGMQRMDQDIADPSRPGLLGESSVRMMSEVFKEAGLPEQLKIHRYEHGSGLNRWKIHGSYPRDAYDQNLPAAGAHSGGTSDIFLAMNCMDDQSIFGQERALSAGILISSFMNFGGYHSFAETFPIAESVASNSSFEVTVTATQRKNLYNNMLQVVKSHAPEAYPQAALYHHAYVMAKKEFTQPQVEFDDYQISKLRYLEALDLHMAIQDQMKIKDVILQNRRKIPTPDRDKLATSKTQILHDQGSFKERHDDLKQKREEVEQTKTEDIKKTQGKVS